MFWIIAYQNSITISNLTLSCTGGDFPSTARGGVNLTRTCLTASEGPAKHILCNIILGTFKGCHQ